MKGICILVVVALLVAMPVVLWAAEDGAALYESKCSMCHGSKGEGNKDSGMPALKGTSMTAEKLVVYLTKGDPTKTMHQGPVGDLTEEQAKLVAAFIKGMK
jgi:cytochrome c553